MFTLHYEKPASIYNPLKICFHYALEVGNLFYGIKSVLQFIHLAR